MPCLWSFQTDFRQGQEEYQVYNPERNLAWRPSEPNSNVFVCFVFSPWAFVFVGVFGMFLEKSLFIFGYIVEEGK